MFKKIFLVAVFLSFSTLGLSSCNTFEGAGKDIEKGGEHLQDAASSTKKKM